jgi:hypothetical protein
MPGHSRPKDGVASLAYDLGIHAVLQQATFLRFGFAALAHGLPGQARQ